MGTDTARRNDDDRAWQRAHEALCRHARQRAAADAEEGRWLLAAWRLAVHVHFGCASFSEYVERVLGYKPRTTQEKLRVAEALEGLPLLAESLQTGALKWCAVRELTRVATADTEQAWRDAAQHKTTTELEKLVASKNPGDGPEPDATTPPRPRPRVLRFEVAPETFSLVREALQRLRRSLGGRVDDDTALLAMARHVLGGPLDAGRSPYQISLTVCEACGNAAQLARGELVPVGAEIGGMAECDGQHIGQLLPRAANENAAGWEGTEDARARDPHDPPSDNRARQPPLAALDEGGAPAAQHTRSDHAHMGAARSGTASSDDANLPSGFTFTRADCADVTQGFDPSIADEADASAKPARPLRSPPPRPRARQSVAPALRRAILARDQGRCRVPGCTHDSFVDVHHIVPRSEGGRNDPNNLLTICGAHHRATHRGELGIERDPGGNLCFRHADGSVYGSALGPSGEPEVVDRYAKVFSALRNLDYREREIRAVISELQTDAELRTASLPALLREALRRIHRGRR